MARLTSQLILSLIDRVSAPARRAAQSVRGITAAIRDGNGQRLRAMADSQRQVVQGLRGDLVDVGATAIALGAALGAPIRAAMSFESAMADVRKVVDFDTPAQFEQMGRDLRRLSREIPITADGLAQMAAAAGQAGIARGDILEFVRAAAMVATAFDITADQAGDALAHLRTGLALTTPQTVLLTDALNELSNRQASTAAGILDVVTRVGAQAKQFGLTGEQVAALGSAMLSTGQAPEVVATSIRNMGQALTRGTAATKRQRGAFAQLGLDATATARRMQVDAVGTIQDVVARLNRLPAYMRAAVSSDLFGDEARALGPLITNQKLLAESLGIVAEQANYAGSAQREYDVRSKTSANRAQLFRNVIANLGITVGTILIPVLQTLTDVLAPVADAVERLTSAHPNLTRAVVIAVGALVAFRLATVTARMASAQTRLALIDAGLAFGALRGKVVAAAVAMRGGLAGAFMAATLQARLFSSSLRAGGARGFAAGLLGLLNPLRLVRGGLALTKLAFRGLLIGSGIGILVLAAGWIVENWTKVKAFFAGFASGFVAAIAPVRPALQPLIDGISNVVGWVRKLLGDSGGSEGSWRSWGEAAGKAIGGVVVWVAKLIGGIGTVIQKAGEMWARLRGGGQAANLPSPRPPGPGRPAAPGRPPGSAPRSVAGARARGGGVRQGEEYLVGEEGPEIFKANRSGTIYPNRELQRAGAGGGRKVVFAPNIGPIYSSGADAQEVAREVMERIRAEYRRFTAGGFGDSGELFV